ncbi:MAG: O-succinylhomoserine sulfhydrylase [Candidatus Velthaea sp.]
MHRVVTYIIAKVRWCRFALSTFRTAKGHYAVDNSKILTPNRASDTLAVHAGRFPQIENRPSSPPLYQASSYEFEDLDDVEAIYDGTRPGAIYGRYGGPNAHHFESAVADLEGAEAAVGASSGMAAIGAALFVTLPPGVPVMCATDLYGGTLALLENDFQQRGHDRVYVDATDPAAVEAAFREHPAPVLYIESLSNPLMNVADIPMLARIAHSSGALLIVDATFATPALARPLAMGADLVLHSVGKYLGGHGDVGAGVVSGSRALIDRLRQWLVRNGATIPHFEAWLALRGMRTLGLRMARHSANAAIVAARLQEIEGVLRVHHPSLPSHPQHALAQRLYPLGTGGIVSFDLAGGRDAVATFVKELRTIALVHSLGEIATTMSYSAASSHRSLDPAARAKLGVTDSTLRLSCGIEDAPDIMSDLMRGFAGLSPSIPASEISV